MLIKDKIIMEEDIENLNNLLADDMNPADKFLIKRELCALDPDRKEGNNPRDYLNFYFEDSTNWAVIHDLRFERSGNWVQIDHILINRSFHVYLLDSKNYSYPVKITADGEFLAFDGHHYLPVDSPLEQIQTHSRLLQEFIFANEIIPRRLGMAIRPLIKPYILMSPQSDLIRPPEWILDSRSVIKADTLAVMLLKNVRSIRKAIQILTRFPKLFKMNTIFDAARKLALLHRSVPVNYSHRFNRITRAEADAYVSQNWKAAEACDNVT